ncbi:hypothetical protein BC830DRAFT_1162971 [Chytriomyces sp. MP71]|nr:hypothetical protein BC830DRAFT_1162971 [Chytriomyces sp. MP71]
MLPGQAVAVAKKARMVVSGAGEGNVYQGDVGVAVVPVVAEAVSMGAAKGIVSASTMQYLAELGERKRNAAVAAGLAQAGAKRKATTALGLAAGYGSDSE